MITNLRNQLIRDEGLVLMAYPDPLTKFDPWKIGVGPMTTLAKALALYPASAPYAPFLAAECEKASITTPLRIACFVAQLAHESGGFHFPKEIWGPTDAQKRYEPPAQLAANLGNTQAGDGKKFMGRGLIQVTGRANVRAASRAKFNDDRLLTDPKWLETPEGAAWSACWYWDSRALNRLADIPDMKRITTRINGGANGLADRLAQFERIKKEIGL